MGDWGGESDELGRLPLDPLDLEAAGGPIWVVDAMARRVVGANAAALALWKVATLAEFSAVELPDTFAGVPLGDLAGMAGGALVQVRPQLGNATGSAIVDCLVVVLRPRDAGALLVFEPVGLRGELVTVFDGNTGLAIGRNVRAAKASRADERHYLDHFVDRVAADRLWRAVTTVAATRSVAELRRRSATAASLEVRAGNRSAWREINLRTLSYDERLQVVLEERPVARRSGIALPPGQPQVVSTLESLGPVAGVEDGITGLGGPVRLVEWLSSIVDEGALLIVEITGFEALLDQCGEPSTIRILTTTAARLAETVRPSDLVVRLGGGRFAAVLPGFSDAAALDRRISEIISRLSVPVQMDGAALPVGVRVGLALWPHDGTSADALERVATAAIGGLTEAVSPSRRRRVAVGDASKLELKRAIDGGEIEAFYQPIIGLDGGRIIGCEALARWNRPSRGLITADQFIQPIEAAGLIWSLGDVMMRQALVQTREWQDRGLGTGRVAVNVGARQLTNAAIVEHVKACLSEAGLTPSQLAVEVTEAIALGPDGHLVLDRLNALHDLGVEIVLDDFGTGHAALALLQRLPVNRLKIDRPVIAGIGVIPSCEPIIRTVTDLAHSLSLQVVAEGVETREQLHFLRLCGCDGVQGNLFAPPMPGREATSWLSKHAHEVAAIDAAVALAGPGFSREVSGRGQLN